MAKIKPVDASSFLDGDAPSRRKISTEKPKWKCEYCGTVYVHETSFMRHSCAQMQRAQEIKTVEGQAAYSYYAEWFKYLKRKAPPIDTFAHSSKYLAFKKLVPFFQKVGLANPSSYIRFMVDNEISPVLWARDASYSMYLTYLDTQYSPLESVKDTITFLKKEAVKINIPTTEFLSYMELTEIAGLVQRRLVTPYFLIFSKIFRTTLSNATDDAKSEFINQVPIQFWANKLMEDSELTESIKLALKGTEL